MKINAIMKVLPPVLRRKIEKIASAKKITLAEAILFCLKGVYT